MADVATTVNVTLTIVPQSGSPFSLTQAVQYRDVVIASLGDSISSGEGAPDAGKNFSISGACDRSTLAGPAQAAVHAQQTLGSAVTVHFWFLACTGAGLSYGLIGSYQPPSGPLLPPQLDRLSQLIGQSGLSVDRLQMTIGANDVYWGALLQACLPIGEYDPGSQTGCVNGYAWEINDALSELPGTFAGLQQKLAALVSPSKVYLTQYSDPLDSLSPQPGLCWGEPIAWQDLRQFGANTESSLQQIMQNAEPRRWLAVHRRHPAGLPGTRCLPELEGDQPGRPGPMGQLGGGFELDPGQLLRRLAPQRRGASRHRRHRLRLHHLRTLIPNVYCAGLAGRTARPVPLSARAPGSTAASIRRRPCGPNRKGDPGQQCHRPLLVARLHRTGHLVRTHRPIPTV